MEPRGGNEGGRTSGWGLATRIGFSDTTDGRRQRTQALCWGRFLLKGENRRANCHSLTSNTPTNSPDQLGTVILLIMKFSTPDFGPRALLGHPSANGRENAKNRPLAGQSGLVIGIVKKLPRTPRAGARSGSRSRAARAGASKARLDCRQRKRAG